MSDHPGVSIIQSKRVGSPLQLKFRIAGTQRKPAAGTCDPQKAREYARKIAHIINNDLIDDPPVGTPPEVLRILGIRGTKLERLDIHLNAEWSKLLQGLLSLLYDEKTGEWQDYSQIGEFQAAFKKFSEQFALYRQRTAEAEARVAELESELKVWKNKAMAYEGHRIKEGLKIFKKFENVTVKKAIAQYLEKGTDSKERFKTESLAPLLKRFSEKVGENTIVVDIPPKLVVEHFDTFKGLAYSTMDQRTTYIKALLSYATGGLYDHELLDEWISKNVQVKKKAEEDYYWPAPELVMTLIRKLKTVAGQFWSDAAAIQYHLALRPEEIIMVQSDNVIFDKKLIKSVYIAPVNAEGIVIRDLKTHDSKAGLPVSSDDVRKALARRLKIENRFLFPRIEDDCGVRPPRLFGRTRARIEKAGTESIAKDAFRQTHCFWTPNMWCRKYLEHLRAAAAQVKRFDLDRLDGRTLRRARGRDIIMQTNSAELAASFLRDDVQTVRDHYAKILPKDIRII